MAATDTPNPAQLSMSPFTGGKVFDKVFTDGMALVERAASYLDGQGRIDAEQLSREPGLTYAAWSMELTTRLMQAASWLVMQKAVRDGEMRREDAFAQRYRITRDGPALEAAAQQGLGLPPRFLELVELSEALYERICRLDRALYVEAPQRPSTNAVEGQMRQLRQAAETGAFDPLKVWGRTR